MAKYLMVFHGGAMPEPAEMPAVMKAWGDWLGGMGAAVVDGGNPVGQSATVLSDGSVKQDGGVNPVSGYTIVEAASQDAALAHAKACPVLDAGGSVEVAEAIDM